MVWNSEGADQFIQDELFPSNLPPMAGTSNFVTPPKPPTIKGLEKELRENLPDFRVIRSGRRKRSIQAFRQNGSIEIHIPDRLTRKQELELIPEMIAMVLEREAKNRRSDDELMKLAQELLEELLPDFDSMEQPKSITWRSMRERWGSCTTVDKTIRISDRLNTAPLYVLKHVIFHELIHLRISDHGEEFQNLLARDPDGIRAESFLEGFELGSSGNSDIYL